LTSTIDAAKISSIHKVPMADSIVLATGRMLEATIWTLDRDFAKLNDVKYFLKT